MENRSIKAAMKKYILLFTLTVIILDGCKKTETENIQLGPLYSIPATLQAWTIYSQGSYWIYRNEKTLVEDSVSVKHGPYYHKELCYNCPVMEYRWYFPRSLFMVKVDVHGGPNGNATAFISDQPSDLEPALTERTLDDPAHADTTIDYGVVYSLVERLDSLSLNGNVITNVVHTRCALKYRSSGNSAKQWDYYWAKNIGLVRYDITYATTDTAWSVLKWHTVQ
jgi:hypothetical protein